MLTGSDLLIVLYVLCDGTEDEPRHNLAWHQGQTDRPVVLWVLFLAVLVDGNRSVKNTICICCVYTVRVVLSFCQWEWLLMFLNVIKLIRGMQFVVVIALFS